MCGFSVVATGSLVFGVISAVFTAIFSLVYFGFIIAVNIYAKDLKDYNPFAVLPLPSAIAVANVILVFVTVKFLIDFLFAVLLCDGICKNKAGYVKAYFIYGIVMTVLGALLDIVAFAGAWQAGLTILAILIVYCLILHMISMAMKEMSAGQVYQYSHKPLVETPLVAC